MKGKAMKRSESYAEMIREAWAARCMGLIMPGVPLSSLPKDQQGLIRYARRQMSLYRSQRRVRRGGGKLPQSDSGTPGLPQPDLGASGWQKLYKRLWQAKAHSRANGESCALPWDAYLAKQK